MRGDAAESLRIERQAVLQAQDEVGEQAPHQAEEQHGEGVRSSPAPAPDRSHQPVCHSLQWLQHRVEPCPAIGVEHPRR